MSKKRKHLTVNNVWDNYFALWSGLTGWKLFLFYTLHYTVLFLLLWHFLFAAFDEAEKTYFWTQDAIPCYFSRLIYLSQTIRGGIQSLLAGNGWTIPLYDFRLGPAKLNLAVEPIQWLAIFCPWDRIDVLYDALVVLRYYLVGLSFSTFGFYFNQKPIPVLAGAVSYTFCGFTLFAGVRHPFFLAPLIFLPLLVIGTEKVLRKERPFLLIIIVFLAMVSSLYFACMLAILVGLYMLIRFPAIYGKNSLREFGHMIGRMAVDGGVGILLAGAVMLPSLLQMIGTGRIGRDVTAFTNMFHYSETYSSRFLTRFLLVPGNIGSWTCLGFSVLSIPAILLLFINRRKETRSLRWLFLTLTAMLLIPAVGYVMSGFNAISNRWCFAYAFCVAAILMFELPFLATANKRTLAKVTIGTLGYFLICYFIVDRKYYTEDPFVFLATSMAILIACNMLEKRRAAAILVACMVLTFLSTYYSAFLMYDPSQQDYASEFTAKEGAYKLFSQSQYASFAKSEASKNDKGFYRVAGDNISRNTLNASYYYDINGLSLFTSAIYEEYMRWWDEMELSHNGGNNYNYGVRGRPPILTLANVKYYVARNAGNASSMYGFKEIQQIRNENKTDRILENEYALPIGYTYSSYIGRDEYDNLSALGKQEAQLQAVVLEKDPVSSVIGEAQLLTTAVEVPMSLSEERNLSWKDSKLQVKEEGADLTLTFVGLPNSETYLRVVNFDLTSSASTRRFDLKAATETTTASARFTADGYLYSNGAKTQLLDLGYTEDGYTTCTITFPQKGTFILDDLQIWCQPIDNYADQINTLREEVLENVEINWRGLTGDISVSRDKILCLLIPYDKGWSAYVDGKEVDLLQANTAFMAVELEAGAHHVELRYWTPGLTGGIALTIIGLAGLVGLIIYWRRKTAKQS